MLRAYYGAAEYGMLAFSLTGAQCRTLKRTTAAALYGLEGHIAAQAGRLAARYRFDALTSVHLTTADGQRQPISAITAEG